VPARASAERRPGRGHREAGRQREAIIGASSATVVVDGSANGPTLGAVTGLDPVLAYNGGPTRTHLIDPASNAVEAGRNAACLNPATGLPLTIDQRGLTRPVDFDLNGVATCDLGAVELQEAWEGREARRPVDALGRGPAHFPAGPLPDLAGSDASRRLSVKESTERTQVTRLPSARPRHRDREGRR
jgi:hypothetical protein